jgi:hypothetical protein
MTAAVPKVTWRSGADAIAHAHQPRMTRTMCGLRVVDERWDRPAFRRCMGCEALVQDLQPVPEGESRALWGSR